MANSKNDKHSGKPDLALGARDDNGLDFIECAAPGYIRNSDVRLACQKAKSHNDLHGAYGPGVKWLVWS